MTKSYRIRTAVNSSQQVDKTIRVNIDQDFDFLEILSLKLTQSDVYRRFCSDYGVVVGRVVANGGFGIPNAKVSIFVPLDDVDENDPIISTLYPYKSPTQKNEDGYRYNLLPYEPSYEGHVATGTFPSKEDILNRKEVLQIYEKYYKYTVTTNESGDYMIVGVPLGNQQVVVDVDLSDIGCFSLRPTDLIRINKGIPSQFDGNNFKSSEDLASLPQILNINRTVSVASFWGVGDNCDIGITRVDFDLRDFDVNIEPTATFMGSIFSSSDDNFLNNNCKPSSEQGDQCGLVTNPGRLLALRQTVKLDENGLPILEQYTLPQGGKVIDENGAFVVDVPMNLDYVTTNEYGELVISDNPKVGIPSRARYRFKVKYDSKEKDLATVSNLNDIIPTQVLNLSTFNPKGSLVRANYLVPNIKEYGWTNGEDPADKDGYSTTSLDLNDGNKQQTITISVPVEKTLAIESISDFEGVQFYVNGVLNNTKWIEFLTGGTLQIVVNKKIRTKVVNGTTVEEPIPVKIVLRSYDYYYVQFQKSYSFSLDWDDYPDITDALNCNDIFYEMVYNKVYTTAQLIDEYRYGTARGRFLSIKEILDRSCQSEVNRFPMNDGVRNFDLIYFIISIFFFITSISFPILIIAYDIIKILWEYVIKYIVLLLVYILSFIVDIVGFISYLFSPSFARKVRGFARDMRTFANSILGYQFPAIKLPMLTYPDCSTCDCGSENFGQGGGYAEANISILADVNSPTSYIRNPNVDQAETEEVQYEEETFNEIYGQLAAGRDNADTKEWGRTPKFENDNKDKIGWLENEIPIPERINMFNGKGKYFTNQVAGGYNRIKVYPNYTANTISAGQYQFYEDQPMVLLVDPSVLKTLTTGQMISFVGLSTSKDVNVSGNTIVTGTTPTTPTITTNIVYANPDNPSSNITTKTFNLVQSYTGVTEYVFPSDIEYHQVITGITIGELQNIVGSSTVNNNSFYRRVLKGYILPKVYYKDLEEDDRYATLNGSNIPIETIENYQNIGVVFLMKGVDPYSTRQNTRIDISLPIGLNSNSVVVESNYKLNKPIQAGLSLVKHNQLTTNNGIFYTSPFFTPSTNSYQGYTAYTTNTHTLFSSYDLSTDGGGVASERIGDNTGGYYKAVTITPSRWGTNRLVTGVDGYYNGEYVEGVSLMSRIYNTQYNQYGGAYKLESRVYNTGSTISMSNTTNIIMRSDRLPRSDQFDDNYILAQNKTFATYLISDNGTFVQNTSIASQSDFSTSQSGDFQDAYGTGTTSLMGSFSCNNIVPLGAYNPQKNQQTISVKQSTDPVYFIDGDNKYPKIENGCYVISSKMFAIGADLQQFAEWKSRFLLNLAICRNVFGMTFTNQWINGTLYMPGFQNDKIYPGIETTNPTYVYCKDKIVFREQNNSFFYRSSPYDISKGFVGMEANKDSNIFGTQQGNEYFLGNPTTMIDLGPKDNIIQNICARPEFQGYYINRLNGTTYNASGELFQLFIISRMTNANFWEQLFALGDASVGEFFSRDNGQKVDGDFAQSISINSELGVVPFSPQTYSNNSLFFGISEEPVMGVFYSADTISRDFVSPGRTTFIDTSKKFGYNKFGYKTQVVPMYKWKLATGQYIFGDQYNDWRTTPINNGAFYSVGYQNIDRLNNDTYYQSPILKPTNQRPGYIYSSTESKDSSGNVTGFTYNGFQQNNTTNEFIVGAPYHFYFGIKYGKTALDKFITNYLVES